MAGYSIWSTPDNKIYEISNLTATSTQDMYDDVRQWFDNEQLRRKHMNCPELDAELILVKLYVTDDELKNEEEELSMDELL